MKLDRGSRSVGGAVGTMTSRERFFAAIDGKPTDIIPIHNLGFSSEVASHLLGREAFIGGGIQQWREATALWNGPRAHQEYRERSLKDAIELAQVCGHDLIRYSYWRLDDMPTAKFDDYTFKYEDPHSGRWHVRRFYPPAELFEIAEQHPPRGEVTFETLAQELDERERKLERGTDPEDQRILKSVLKGYSSTHAVRVHGCGLGIPYKSQAWLEAILLRPDLVERSLDLEVESGLRELKVTAALGARLAFGGNDMASNEGTFYSPAVFRRLMLPRLRTLTKAARDVGILPFFASDGNLWPVADDLFGRSGLKGFLEVDGRAGMDLALLRERFPDVAFIGNMSSHTVHLGTPEEIRMEAEKAFAAARRYSGIVVGVSNYLVPGTPRENVDALMQALHDLR